MHYRRVLIKNTSYLRKHENTNEGVAITFVGQIEPSWASVFESVLDGNGLDLVSGERIIPNENVRFIFETDTLDKVSSKRYN